MQVEGYFEQSGETGGRVRNAYATCLIQGDSPWKRGLKPHRSLVLHGTDDKAEVV
jgi:hypothetical protein